MIPILGKPIRYTDYTSAKVFVHWLPWWNTLGHISMQYALPNGKSVPYDSANTAICDAQCIAMLNQGISGINVDWYGPDAPSSLASLKMLDACERAGLSYSICIDKGALGNLTGAAATAEYIRILKFDSEAFFVSPAYLQDAGRFIVNVFGEPAGEDWGAIQAANPKVALLFENASGFTHPNSSGAYGWVNPITPVNNINLPSIQAFVSAAAASASKLAFYPIYSGFDDSMASWGKGRYMSRRLGQTMLDTLAQIPKSAKYALISTWNDYEENTATELSQG